MRGFCTIATGSYEYSQLAYNLLMSYRRFASKNYPFVVFTDQSNELLESFDQVIIIDQSQKSFVDKLLIFELCPFEETIFIDADSLAYGDLTRYFDYFEKADDVSCMGKVFEADSISGWFRKADVEPYYYGIEYTVGLHGGIYFVRNTENVKAFYKTCRDIEKNYKKIFFRFKYLIEPADEPIVALAMALHKFKPIEAKPEILAFYRDSRIDKIDIVSGELEYHVSSGDTKNGMLVHWATPNTRKALYETESEKLKWALAHGYERRPMKFYEKLCWNLRLVYKEIRDRLKGVMQKHCG